jgi:hypothetical protein
MPTSMPLCEGCGNLAEPASQDAASLGVCIGTPLGRGPDGRGITDR